MYVLIVIAGALLVIILFVLACAAVFIEEIQEDDVKLCPKCGEKARPAITYSDGIRRIEYTCDNDHTFI